ncbi:hypothetical protein [Streptomyces sp. NPDC048411]|uniref:hypothetical protein n=1 Tax=Streptomyces sp. NPDC048411 TaxID=3157206 RepID=UPI003454812D
MLPGPAAGALRHDGFTVDILAALKRGQTGVGYGDATGFRLGLTGPARSNPAALARAD